MKHHRFIFDKVKSEKLKSERGIGFEDVISLIECGCLVDIKPHPNQEKYPNQLIYELSVDGYIYLAPFEIKEDGIVLKTVFANRKATKKHKRKGSI